MALLFLSLIPVFNDAYLTIVPSRFRASNRNAGFGRLLIILHFFLLRQFLKNSFFFLHNRFRENYLSTGDTPIYL